MWLYVLAAILAIAVGLLLIAWQRARANAALADDAITRVERMRRSSAAEAEWAGAQLEALLAAQADAVLLVSPEHGVLNLNPGARLLFGEQAAAGQSVILATRSVELDELVDHCLAGGADCDRQIALGRGSVPHRVRAVAVGRPAGSSEHNGVVLVLHDLGEVQRLGRARRDFVANISHELRTPITSIRLLVDTLRGAAMLDDAARNELLEKISVETDAMGQLAQELLDLAEIESGQAMVRLVPTSVAAMVSSVTDRLGPQAERKQQTLDVHVPPELLAWADPSQMTRALGNLLHNAIKFTPAAGEIRLTASALDGEITIEVRDTGPGITPRDLARVFERFYRGDRARERGGTGLGLAIAKHVVEAHGGRIWVESAGRIGQGAVFRFTLRAA